MLMNTSQTRRLGLEWRMLHHILNYRLQNLS